MARRAMRAALLTVHRYVSLCLALFWLVQVLTGISLVYARSLDDAALGATGRAASPVTIDHVLHRIERPDRRVLQYFVSGGIAGQIDVLVDEGAKGLLVWRIDGATGRLERVSAWDGKLAEMPLARSILLLHKSLLAGAHGRILLMFSGAALFINLLIALRLAWPAKRRWSAVMLPRHSPNPVATWFSWHRSLGLWSIPFGLVAASTGLGLLFTPNLQRLIGSDTVLPAVCKNHPSRAQTIDSARAVGAASSVFPGASVVVVSLPAAGNGCYVVQMRQPAEWRRIFGTSQVYIDAVSFVPVAKWDALAANLPARAVVALYTVHSGEWGRTPSRIATMLLAGGLLATLIAGLSLWWSRRRDRLRKHRGQKTASAG